MQKEVDMLFKDEAHALVSKWENISSHEDLCEAAALTAVALSRTGDVPSHVLEALDYLLGTEYQRQGTSVYHVVAYLRGLTDERGAARLVARAEALR
jgi:hypothetical protein